MSVHQFSPGDHALLFGRSEVVILEAIPGVGTVDVQRLAPAANKAANLRVWDHDVTPLPDGGSRRPHDSAPVAAGVTPSVETTPASQAGRSPVPADDRPTAEEYALAVRRAELAEARIEETLLFLDGASQRTPRRGGEGQTIEGAGCRLTGRKSSWWTGVR